MKRMKLFVIDMHNGIQWEPRYLHRDGSFRDALTKAQSLMGPCIRVRRVKTPAERDQYLHLKFWGDKPARTEWVN